IGARTASISAPLAPTGVVTWNVTTGGSWNVGSNWDTGTVPASGSDIVFSSATATRSVKPTTLDANFTIHSLTFNAAQTGNVTIAQGSAPNGLLLSTTDGATSITVNAASGDHTISADLDLIGVNQVFDIGSGRTFTINAAVIGSNFTKDGAGTLSLGGATDNIFGSFSGTLP